MTDDSVTLREALQAVAPGTDLREGLERIKRSHTGALIVLGYTPEIEAMCSGGFDLDIPFSASRLRELCKMDGAVILDKNNWQIRKANVQLLPDPSIPVCATARLSVPPAKHTCLSCHSRRRCA